MAALLIAPSPMVYQGVRNAALAAAVREGDTAFQAFDNESARHYYQLAFDIDSTNCDVLWKLARADVHRGMVAPDKEKSDWYASGEQLSRRCVALYPDSSEAHFYLAVSIGQMSKLVGTGERIELSEEIKREAETTLLLNPKHYGAMHVLGRWNYELAGLGWFSRAAAKVVYGGVPGGSYEIAKQWFERAIVVRPDFPLNHLWLGETLIKLHDYPRARDELQLCLMLDDVLWDDPITKTRARKTLREIEGKK